VRAAIVCLASCCVCLRLLLTSKSSSKKRKILGCGGRTRAARPTYAHAEEACPVQGRMLPTLQQWEAASWETLWRQAASLARSPPPLANPAVAPHTIAGVFLLRIVSPILLARALPGRASAASRLVRTAVAHAGGALRGVRKSLARVSSRGAAATAPGAVRALASVLRLALAPLTINAAQLVVITAAAAAAGASAHKIMCQTGPPKANGGELQTPNPDMPLTYTIPVLMAVLGSACIIWLWHAQRCQASPSIAVGLRCEPLAMPIGRIGDLPGQQADTPLPSPKLDDSPGLRLRARARARGQSPCASPRAPAFTTPFASQPPSSAEARFTAAGWVASDSRDGRLNGSRLAAVKERVRAWESRSQAGGDQVEEEKLAV